jgi:ubiquinone/menaquinone biosynthesis C-methylase UbiE
MTVAAAQPGPLSRFVSGLLRIPPIYAMAKARARQMMVKRADQLGIGWQRSTDALRSRGSGTEFSPDWEATLAALTNLELNYPSYYVTSFHAYSEGNLGWEPALEVEVAALAVHARIWPEAGAQGDARLRQSYHEVLLRYLSPAPQTIIDLGCSVGMSTFTLQDTFPGARLTGIDLSPYFLAVAQYRAEQQQRAVQWVHVAAEQTGLPSQSADLISCCLVYHELPQSAATAIVQEAHRLLTPGGHLAIMDMNPHSETFAKMPPVVLTLLKSTEPYLDEYFRLDLNQTLQASGFNPPIVVCNSPRHRTVIARKPSD